VWADASVLLKNDIHAVVIEQVCIKWCQNVLMFGVNLWSQEPKMKKGMKGKRHSTPHTAHSPQHITSHTPHNPNSK